MGRAGWALFALLAGLAGCGESGGVEEGATVTAYVTAPLCAGAERELARQGGRAGEVRVRIVCLPAGEADGRLDLARIGANARRATEDSSAVAFLAPPTHANRFSRPILDSAEIPLTPTRSGVAAVSRLLRELREDPREPRRYR